MGAPSAERHDQPIRRARIPAGTLSKRRERPAQMPSGVRDTTPNTERGLAAQSPRKPNGLSHCIFERLIVEASAHAQNQLSVLADGYTERCRGVFDSAGDG